MAWMAPLDIGLTMGLIFAWAVLSVALSFRLLNFPDLTAEGSLPLGAALCAVLLKCGLPPAAATALALLAGAGAGALTAFLHLRFRLNKFLAGIVVVAVTYSLSLRLMGTSNIGLLQSPTVFDPLRPLDGAGVAGLHAGRLLLLALIISAGAALLVAGLSSRWGLRLRVAGSNPVYARSVGIAVNGHMIVGLALTNVLAALSGALLAMHQGFADVGMGQGVLVLALASMTIGERLAPAGNLGFVVFVTAAAVGGSAVYQLLTAYAISMGIAPTDLKMATAVLVLAVVVLRRTRDDELTPEVL